MIAFDRRLLANTADYHTHFVTKATRVDILEVEDKMTQVLSGYSQQQTAVMGLYVRHKNSQEWFR